MKYYMKSKKTIERHLNCELQIVIRFVNKRNVKTELDY